MFVVFFFGLRFRPLNVPPNMNSLKSFLRANAWIVIVVTLVVVALIQLVDPAPPSELTLAAGSEGGRYFEIAHQLKRDLADQDVTLHIIETAGSGENMDLLIDEESPVSIAFVQSGMEEIFDSGDAELFGLASLYYEPIWIFHRTQSSPFLLTDLAGKRIAIGADGSGTKAVSQFLLRENGINSDKATLIEKGGEDAIALFKSNEIDCAFFTVSPLSDTIQELIHIPDISFMNIRRHEAHTARYPFLSSVKISKGMLDLQQDIPRSDKHTLASTATLVVNKDFHPAITPLILETLSKRLKFGSVLEERDVFPSPDNVGFPLTKEADHYFEYGPPFLLRYMPFWAASLVDRLVIFIIPLLVILIPLSKLAGPIYRWRIRSRIYRWYKYLRESDAKINDGSIHETIKEEKEKLRKLESELSAVEVPLSYTDNLYHLKRHVEDVAQRIERIEETKS